MCWLLAAIIVFSSSSFLLPPTGNDFDPASNRARENGVLKINNGFGFIVALLKRKPRVKTPAAAAAVSTRSSSEEELAERGKKAAQNGRGRSWNKPRRCPHRGDIYVSIRRHETALMLLLLLQWLMSSLLRVAVVELQQQSQPF